jgi:outer membrane protein OmpA-like peptidoglycan-associated protein
MYTSTKSNTRLIAAFLAMSLAGCASAPREDSRLSRAEFSLTAAYGNRYTSEYGNADLASAETSLAAARIALRKGRDGELDHELTMAENHIALGKIHGEQERIKAETAALKDQQDRMRLASRERELRQANNQADSLRAEAAAANQATQNANDRADSSRAEADLANAATQDANNRAASLQAASLAAAADKQAMEAKMAAMHSQLAMYDLKVTELGATLVLREVMFNVDSSLLLPGAVSRLDPLIAYLQASPATTVRIDGHTDSSGSVTHNDTLSLDRANSVKRALLTNLSMTNAIETHGYGQNRPVATNATASGRQENRRVEITLQ